MLAQPRKSMAHAHNAHLAAAKQAAAIAAAAGLSGSNHLHPGSTDKGGGSSSGAGQILMHSGASRTLGGGTGPRTGRAWHKWPKPFNRAGAALDTLANTWDAVTSDHLRNNRVLCVGLMTVLLALIIESYVTVPAVPDSLIARDGIAAWKVTKWNGRVIWFLQLCTTLIALVASGRQSAATNAYRYQVMFHLAVTMVLGSAGVIFYMIYGNAWQLGEILCGTTRQLVCTDTDWGTKIISEAWHWRYVVFLVSQALTVQGIVTHLLELLAMQRDAEKKKDATNQGGGVGGTSRVVLAQY
ncbi:hypothetical protein GGF31_002133 [Allomyces arbusculus]|nr:hypothetical protein GGF31_002133 [Allomyces arbusculus]